MAYCCPPPDCRIATPCATLAAALHSVAPRTGTGSRGCAADGAGHAATASHASSTAYNGRVSDVFTPLSTDSELDRVLAASHAEPVIVFKHSESCGASWMAETSLGERALPV